MGKSFHHMSADTRRKALPKLTELCVKTSVGASLRSTNTPGWWEVLNQD